MSLPLENLDNKKFEELVEEAKKRIPIYAPGWTDYNLHDPGIMLIELFAWLTEMQIYRLNKVTDEAVWKFLKLVEIEKGSESLEQAVLQARKEIKTVSRAVTCGDYETLALSAPSLNVARARAIPGYHPNQHQEVPGIVTLVVIPNAPEPPAEPGASFLRAVYSHLYQHRLLTTELFVLPPQYVQVSVKAEVVIHPEYLGTTVSSSVDKGLKNFLHPLIGGPDGLGWPFGRPVYLSEIYEVIDRAPGVDYVTTVALKKEKGRWTNDDIMISPHSVVYTGSHMINAFEKKRGKK